MQENDSQCCISTVIIRDDSENFRVIDTKDWIDDDDSLTGDFGY